MDGLREAIAESRATLFVGTGITVAVTGRPDLSWIGLLRSGVRRAVELKLAPSEQWAGKVESDIEYGISCSDADALASAGQMVTKALGGASGEAFRAWLSAEVGGLKITDPKPIEAMLSLGVPILTTNYDTSIEEVSGYTSVTWQDHARMQSVMTGRVGRIVGHLHGVWDRPDSIVLSASDYSRITSDAPAQALQQAVHAMRSAVFVGFGSGLDDANFGGLRSWYESTLGATPHQHFRLCLQSELESLRAEHAQENIEVVAYGETYADLPEFLASLRPTSLASRAPVRRVDPLDAALNGYAALSERVRDESILSDFFPDLEVRTPDQLLIRPVLLPMPQENFSSAQNLAPAVRPRRADPDKDALSASVMVVAGEEQVGLTSALEWLLHARAQSDRSLTPMVIDFRALGSNIHPLSSVLRRQATSNGIIAGRTDPLPPIALALDNFSGKPERIADRALSDLREIAPAFLVVGCRQGEEIDVVTLLSKLGLRPALRYVGRMNHADMNALARLAAPTRANSLAQRALELINREHLPRTPFTFGLLLTVLMHGETFMAASSETALLDAYVNVLMGRGDPHEDARFSLDAHERSDILANLAELYVERRVGSISQRDFTGALGDYFNEVGWDENSHAVFENFLKRRLLVARGDQVAFAQSSYLHLFAAKRAVDSEEFRATLMEKPLYFSPILRHYAALTRHDARLLRSVDALLDIEEWAELPSRFFSESDAESHEAPENLPEMVDDLFDRIEASVDAESDEDEQEAQALVRAGGPAARDWLDRIDDSDQHPFPFAEIDAASPVVKLGVLAGLVSTVLRDSELVRDLELKRTVLRKTLVVWGRFVDALDADQNFGQDAREIAEIVAESLGQPNAQSAEFIEEFMEMVAALTSFGVMSQNLSSRKLIRTLSDVMADPDFMASSHGAVMGALLAFDIQSPGWASFFASVQREHPTTTIVGSVMTRMALLAYVYQEPGPVDLRTLEDFLVDQWVARFRFSGAVAQKDAIERFRQRLRRMRRMSGNRLSGGETMFSGAIEGNVSTSSTTGSIDA
ncbi:SIR2 family NAD-dependent protein deacylase [Oryzihumus leptocrescens]|uniref:SIR2 family NAD-dependent protein deacylase n=1 Tax=Oryzihumus leptocrescens TaxID=297536 RepID=UPI00115218E9|nr:SIR2 family protein [Oryzihumus leptocrescens]